MIRGRGVCDQQNGNVLGSPEHGMLVPPVQLERSSPTALLTMLDTCMHASAQQLDELLTPCTDQAFNQVLAKLLLPCMTVDCVCASSGRAVIHGQTVAGVLTVCERSLRPPCISMDRY
jgi:hypothetical protein